MTGFIVVRDSWGFILAGLAVLVGLYYLLVTR